MIITIIVASTTTIIHTVLIFIFSSLFLLPLLRVFLCLWMLRVQLDSSTLRDDPINSRGNSGSSRMQPDSAVCAAAGGSLHHHRPARVFEHSERAVSELGRGHP